MRLDDPLGMFDLMAGKHGAAGTSRLSVRSRRSVDHPNILGRKPWFSYYSERAAKSAYADARSNPLRFFVLPGHEDLQIEQVVLRTPTYLVVKKVGEAAREILDEDSGGRAEE